MLVRSMDSSSGHEQGWDDARGGFCTPRSMELLSESMGVPITEITKRGGGSWIITERDAVERKLDGAP